MGAWRLSPCIVAKSLLVTHSPALHSSKSWIPGEGARKWFYPESGWPGLCCSISSSAKACESWVCENMELIFIITAQDKELEGKAASVCLAITVRGMLWKNGASCQNPRFHLSSEPWSWQPQPCEPPRACFISSPVVAQSIYSSLEQEASRDSRDFCPPTSYTQPISQLGLKCLRVHAWPQQMVSVSPTVV